MGKQTVFVKRYIDKGELPKEDNKYYCSNVGMVYFRKHKFYFRDEQLITFTDKVEWWLEKIELPSEEEIDVNLLEQGSRANYALYEAGYKDGINFILNKLK